MATTTQDIIKDIIESALEEALEDALEDEENFTPEFLAQKLLQFSPEKQRKFFVHVLEKWGKIND